VLGGVVLEDAPEVWDQRDQRQVDEEDGDADDALDRDEGAGRLDREEVRDQRRRHLEEHQREADRDRERDQDLPSGDLGLDVALGRVRILGGVVG
jgi:hypothetical protein